MSEHMISVDIYVDRNSHPHKPDYQYHVSAHLAGIPPLGYRIVVPEDNNGGTTYKSYVVVEGSMRTHEPVVILYCRAV